MSLFSKIIIYLLGLILLIILGAAAVLYFIPEKVFTTLKPTIEQFAGQYLDADLSFEDISLIGFPQIAVVIKEVKFSPHQNCCAVSAKTISIDLSLAALYKVWREISAEQNPNYLKYAIALNGLELETLTFPFNFEGITHQVNISTANAKLKYDENILQFSDSSIESRLDNDDLTLSSQNISYNLNNKQLSVQDLLLGFHGGEIKISSSSKIDNFDTQASLIFENVDFSLFAETLRSFDPQVPALATVVTGNLNLTYDNALSVNGSLDFKNLSYPSFNLKISNGSVRDIALDLSSEGQIDLKSKLQLTNFSYEEKGVSYKFNSSNSDLTYNKNNTTQTLKGTLEFKNVSSPTLNLSASSSSFSDLLFELDSIGQINLKSKLKLTDFSFEGKDTNYKIGSDDLDFTYSKSSIGQTVIGNSLIDNFAFSDGTTSVQKTNAELKNIKALINPKGDISVNLEINGSSLILNTPTVTVSSIQSVHSPLTVSFPAKGDYLIAGPVYAAGVQGTVANRSLSNTQATVAMSIAGLSKTFSTKNFQTNIGGTDLKLSTEFNMNNDAFSIKPSVLNIASGTINFYGAIRRNINSSFSVDATASEILTENVLPLFQIETPKDHKLGTLRALTLAVSGPMTDTLNKLVGDCTVAYMLSPDGSSRWHSLIQNALQSIPSLFSTLTMQKDKSASDIGLINAHMNFASGGAQIDKLTLIKKLFSLQGNGTVKFDGTLNLQANVIFLRNAFSTLGLGIAPLANLFGRLGQISIPITILGTIKDPNVSADIGTFLKNTSGLTLIGDAATGAADVGTAIYDVLSSPFGRRTTPTATQVPANN